jgi:hypothetical protein
MAKLNSKTSNNSAKLIAAMLVVNIIKLIATAFALNIIRLVAIY